MKKTLFFQATKRIALAMLTALWCFGAQGQTADERVGEMMNASRWFELKDFYETKNDSVTPFLDKFARTMLADVFDRSQEVVSHASDLLNNHAAEIGLDNTVSMAYVLSNHLSRLGQNGAAANALSTVLASLREQIDSAEIAIINRTIEIYKVKSAYPNIAVRPFGEQAVANFRLDTINHKKPAGVIRFTDSSINGHAAGILFDSGAGVNVMSDSVAAALRLKVHDVEFHLYGFGTQQARMTVVKELKLGELTLTNVPFYVATAKSGHPEADKYLKCVDIIVGQEIMQAVKHFTIDFPRRTFTFQRRSSIPEGVKANLYAGTNANYRLLATTPSGGTLLFCPDTGDASFGTFYPNAYPKLGNRVAAGAALESRRLAGFGGWSETKYYTLTAFPLTISGVTATLPSIPLVVDGEKANHDGNLGLGTFMLFKAVSFDLDRMIMQPIP